MNIRRPFVTRRKKPRILTEPQIACLVDGLTNGRQRIVANANQRSKVLLAAKFAGKRVTTRRNQDDTYTVFALL